MFLFLFSRSRDQRLRKWGHYACGGTRNGRRYLDLVVGESLSCLLFDHNIIFSCTRSTIKYSQLQREYTQYILQSFKFPLGVFIKFEKQVCSNICTLARTGVCFDLPVHDFVSRAPLKAIWTVYFKQSSLVKETLIRD